MSVTPIRPRMRPLPANIEAEQGLLGTILCDNRTYAQVAGFLTPNHFSNGVNAHIYAAIGELISGGRPATPVTLNNRFDDDELFGSINASEYIAALAQSAVTLINAKDYARIVFDTAQRRTIIIACEDLVDALKHGAPLKETSALFWGRISEAVPPQTGRIKPAKLLMDSFLMPDWLIEGILQRGSLYACTSPTGHGKTAVWLLHACMIHAGRTIGRLITKKGNVLYVAGENVEDIKARLFGMCAAFNLTPQDLPYFLPAAFPLNEIEAASLLSEINGLGVAFSLIIFDTAASFFPGDDENDNVLAGTYARTMRLLTQVQGNPAVLALSHPTKNAASDHLLPRGGGAFLNELDANLTLWSADQEITTLHWQGKIRGPDFAPLSYRLRPVQTGFIDSFNRNFMTVVADPVSEEESNFHRSERTDNEDRILRLINANPDQSLADLARHAGWFNDAGEPLRPKVQRTIAALSGDGLIIQPRKGGKWSLTNKGRQILENE
jgi:hypothetical protein